MKQFVAALMQSQCVALAAAALIAGSSRAEVAPWSQSLAANLHPGLGRGDFEFSVDATGLRRAEGGKTVTRVLVQLPLRSVLEQAQADAAELQFRVAAFPAGDALEELSRLEAEARTKSPRESDLHQSLENRESTPAAAGAELRVRAEAKRQEIRDTDYQNFELFVELVPGDYVFEVTCENLSRLKKGLLDRMRKRALSSVARLLVRVPDLYAPVAIADPIFESGYGAHTDYAARVYGLLNDSLHVRATIFATGSGSVQCLVRDRDGVTVWQDSLRREFSGSGTVAFHSTVNSLPAGQYMLWLHAAFADAQALATRSFGVAWSITSWTETQRTLELEADVILNDEMYDRYKGMPLAEKERTMAAFWARYDPTPETAVNELREEFHRRVAYADLHFSDSRRGALSDRGRVYVRLGPPEEVQAEAVSGHLAGGGSDDVMTKVEDPYSPSDHFAVRENLSGARGSIRDVTPQAIAGEHSRVIGPGRELVSFELWIYAGSGSPLLPEDRAVIVDSGCRVLFTDTQGFGDFKFGKASAALEIRGLRASY